MGLDMGHRKGLAAEMAKRYRKASKQKKGQLIKEYVELTKCSRHYAAWLLRCWGTTVWTRHQGRPVKIVVGQRRARRRTPRVYDQEVVAALIKLWHHFGYLRQTPGGRATPVVAELRALGGTQQAQDRAHP